jgi:hypothetical protein
LAPSETNFINTAAEAIRFVNYFHTSSFKIILDVKAMSSEAIAIPEIIKSSWPHFAYFHANDRNLKGPGFGDVISNRSRPPCTTWATKVLFRSKCLSLRKARSHRQSQYRVLTENIRSSQGVDRATQFRDGPSARNCPKGPDYSLDILPRSE